MGCLYSDGSRFGTLTNVSVFYRIVGGNIEIQGKFQAGTVTGSQRAEYIYQLVTHRQIQLVLQRFKVLVTGGKDKSNRCTWRYFN